MLTIWMLVLGGVVLLYVGAESLVRGSVSLAARRGLSPLVIGLTVVAFGTSMPELVVSLRAALAGNSGLAVGNVVGSNIANIALILGISALIRPIKVELRLVRRDVPVMMAVSVGLAALLWDDHLGRVAGAALLAGLVVYVVLNLRAARHAPSPSGDTSVASASTARDVFFIGLGLGMLVSGASMLVSGAVDLARLFSVPEAIIGLSVVAVGTSLPELATSILAAARGEGDIAVGNVVGSNLFNILGILGLSALVHPLGPTGVAPMDLAMMVALCVVLLPFLRTGFLLSRREGGVLLAAYAAYVAVLIN